MDDEEFKSSVFVKIEPPLSEIDEREELLNMYLENITGTDSVVAKLNKSRNWAIVNLIGVEDISSLKTRIDERPLANYKITLQCTPTWNKIIVNGLQKHVIEEVNNQPFEHSELCLHFESNKFCPEGGYVTSITVLPCLHAAIVGFEDPNVVRRLSPCHRISGSEADTRPLEYFEYVEDPVCVVCNQSKVTCMENNDKESEEHDSETNVKCRSRSNSDDEKSNSEDSCNDNVPPGTSRNNDSDQEELEELKNWTSTSSAEHPLTSRKEGDASREEGDASRSSKISSTDQGIYTQNPDTMSILIKTIKYEKMPGWNSELYNAVKLRKHDIEIRGPNQQKIQKALDDAISVGEVDLADYTKVADKLASKAAIKWIEDLLGDTRHPVVIKKDKTTVRLKALNIELAIDAAKTVERSLLPAKITCSKKQMAKFSKEIRNGKNSALIAEEDGQSGCLRLLGIPLQVIEAVRNIERQL